MYLLQITNSGLSSVLVIGTLCAVVIIVGLVGVIALSFRKVSGSDKKVQQLVDNQQKMLLNASVKLQEEDRHRLAADLHDDAGPLLATARLYLNDNLVNVSKEDLGETVLMARQIIDEVLTLIRNISHNLLPPTLRNFGLESAVNDLFEKISNSGVIKATKQFHDYERLPEEKELIIFRIIQELVNNILKHSEPTFIRLTQNKNAAKFFIRIHHDGHGLLQPDFEELNNSSSGLGIKNISSRLQIVQGSIRFEKDSEAGFYHTTIQLPIS